jgi:hypothetical protein
MVKGMRMRTNVGEYNLLRGRKLPTYIHTFLLAIAFVIENTRPFHPQIPHSPRSGDDDEWQPTSLVRGERQALTIDESVNDEDSEQEHPETSRRLRTGDGAF